MLPSGAIVVGDYIAFGYANAWIGIRLFVRKIEKITKLIFVRFSYTKAKLIEQKTHDERGKTYSSLCLCCVKSVPLPGF